MLFNNKLLINPYLFITCKSLCTYLYKTCFIPSFYHAGTRSNRIDKLIVMISAVVAPAQHYIPDPIKNIAQRNKHSPQTLKK